MVKAYDICERPGGNACLEEEFSAKPPRMWPRTYERLREQADEEEKNVTSLQRLRNNDRYDQVLASCASRHDNGA